MFQLYFIRKSSFHIHINLKLELLIIIYSCSSPTDTTNNSCVLC